MVVIRADANSKIGMGHVMRCLSVADALLKRGEEVLFVTADDTPVPLLTKKGVPYRVLHTYYADMEAELPGLLCILQELTQRAELPEEVLSRMSSQRKDIAILVDSYYVTEKYLAALKKRITTIYMDDIYAFSYPVDMLINYNIYGEEMGYEKDAAFADTKLLLGTKYVPLREEFSQAAGYESLRMSHRQRDMNRFGRWPHGQRGRRQTAASLLPPAAATAFIWRGCFLWRL